MRLKFDEFFLNFYISRSSGGLTNHRAKKKIVEFLVKSAIPEDSWELLPTSDSSYEKWLNGTRTFNPAVWQEIAEKYDENRFLEIVIRELNDNALVTVMDRFGIKVSTVNEIDKELFTVAIGQQLREIARGTGSAEKVVQNIYSNTESKEIFPVYKQKALAEYSKVKTNFSDELCEMKDVFICNTLSTVDSAYSRRGMPARGTVIQDATLDKIAEQSNMVALIANGGMGKSMMLRHLFVESMKKYSETGVMPILVELRDFRFAGCDLLSCIVKSVSMFDLSFNDEAADKVLRAGKCQILLDGLDEIDPSDMVAFQHRLREMIKIYPMNQYVITSRECDVAKSIGFRSRLYLMPFDDRQTGDLIDKLIKDDGVKAELTRNLNEGYLNKHGEFASNPMLLTFCIMNYPSYQSFYDRPHEFYRSAYDTILSDHDMEKSPLDRVFRSADSQDDFTDVFREFCAISYVERKFQFNKMTFEAIFKKLKSTKQVANPRIMNKTNFLHDACATACMMYEAKSDILYIMDMTTDEAVGEVTHSKTEKVSGDCLHNVLYEFRAVAFDSFPFFSGADAFIGYGFTAESIFSDTRFDVAKSSTGRKLDEEYPTSTEEFDSVYLCRNLHFYSSLYGIIHIPPEGSNIWIGGTPGINKWLKFILC